MAYNILKGEVQFVNATSGTIESMVDDHSNQTIAGVKTFSTAITASGFYDALLGERIVNSAITNIVSGASNRVVVFESPSVIGGSEFLTFTSGTLYAPEFSGSAGALINIPVAEFDSLVPEQAIDYGDGLTGSANKLTLKLADNSLSLSLSGLSTKLQSSQGITLEAGGLRVNPNNANLVGGALANTDEFLISRAGTTNKATISLLQTYMQNSLTFRNPAGSTTQIQFNDAGAFGASPNLTWNGTSLNTTIISASTGISASSYQGDGSKLTNLPGGTLSITSSNSDFNIPGAYDMFMIDTNSNVVTGTLPLASAAPVGKIFRFKDAGGNCGVNNFVIEASGSDTIDGATGVKIQVAFGSVAMFNDGSNYRILY